MGGRAAKYGSSWRGEHHPVPQPPLDNRAIIQGIRFVAFKGTDGGEGMRERGGKGRGERAGMGRGEGRYILFSSFLTILSAARGDEEARASHQSSS